MQDDESRTQWLFHQALPLAPDERVRFLEHACAGNEPMRAVLVRLLDAHDTPGTFLEEPGPPPLGDDADAEIADRRIGAYRVLRKIGEGGMGAVYLGERADGAFERYVAIKVIRFAQVSSEFLARFQRERRIHALLDHEYIAQVYDAGMTQDGMPYLVMEYVDGLPITDYCDAHRLDRAARIALMRRVCDAVAYAHSHRSPIVHRDLTHRNVLVTAAGAPKVLDFGIAKVLEGRDQEVATQRGQAIGTPGYWSPQQEAGREVDRGDDIFALGALLCRLLTGALPTSGSPAAVSGTQPDDVTREARGTTPTRQLPAAVSTLPADVQAIVARSTEVDPAHRYASVVDFSEDLRRVLAGEPVMARPQTWLYVTRKFVVRHRARVTLAGAALAALVAALTIAIVLWSRARAERQLADARAGDLRALSTVMFQLDEDLRHGSTNALGALMQRATGYLDRLGTQGDDPTLAIERAAGYVKVADTLGNPQRANLGRPAEARRIYEQAIALLESSPAELRAEPRVAMLFATARAHLADVLMLQDVTAAEQAYRQALALMPSSASWASAADAEVLRAGILRPLGDIALDSGRVADALTLYQQARTIDEALCQRWPDRSEYRRLAALSAVRVGDALARQGRFDEALAGYTEARTALERLDATTPRREEVQRDLGVALGRLGTSMIPHDRTRALTLLDASARLLDELAKTDPTNARVQLDAIVAALHYADAIEAHEQARAATLYREVARRSRALGDDEEGRRIRDVAESRVTRSTEPTETSGVAAASGAATATRAASEADRPTLSLVWLRPHGDLLVTDFVPALPAGSRVAVQPSAHPGRRRYLLRITGDRAVTLLPESALTDGRWTQDVSGPPSETWILLVLAAPLQPDAVGALVDQLRHAPFEPMVEPGRRIVWDGRRELPLLRMPSARGGAQIPAEALGPWARDFVARLRRLPGVAFSGLTIPVEAVK